MSLVVDTNVLVYASLLGSTFHALARKRLLDLKAGGENLVVTTQVLREYVAVVTRRVGEKPLSVPDALDDVARFRKAFVVLADPPDVLERWLSLVHRHGVKGAACHDAFLVAVALGNGVEGILTHNTKHFEPFDELRIVPLVI